MLPASALILLLCLAAQPRSGLDVDASGFAARFDSGTPARPRGREDLGRMARRSNAALGSKDWMV